MPKVCTVTIHTRAITIQATCPGSPSTPMRMQLDVATAIQVGKQRITVDPPRKWRRLITARSPSHQWTMQTSVYMARRIEEFVRYHLVRGQPYYDCGTLVYYACGGMSLPSLRRIVSVNVHSTPELHHESQAGKPYIILGSNHHLTLGIDAQSQSVGILGAEGPLVVCSNRQLMAMYGGITFNAVQRIDVNIH